MTSDVTGSPISRSITQPAISTYGVQSISLEPTVFLDQMKRYLDHLHELRRINEGDDTADSPGYSLNLVRIPISVLPGKRTRKGLRRRTDGYRRAVSYRRVAAGDLAKSGHQ